ncbi:MAG: hypothetical protein ACRD9L_22995 [Bryobacteraceae bacterium]
MQIALVTFDGILRLLFYSLLGAAVYRLFTIGSDLAEIKEILRDFKRSGDVMLRAAANERHQPIPDRTGRLDISSQVPEAVHDGHP